MIIYTLSETKGNLKTLTLLYAVLLCMYVCMYVLMCLFALPLGSSGGPDVANENDEIIRVEAEAREAQVSGADRIGVCVCECVCLCVDGRNILCFF